MSVRRFRVHLSTAIVLMLAAGVLLWANFSHRTDFSFDEAGNFLVYSHGWPCHVKRASAPFNSMATDVTIDERILWSSVAVNVAVALVILFACGFACEWRIRRREAKAT